MIVADLLERARSVSLAEAAQMLGLRLPRAGEYAGPCPACGGRDRFSINPRKGVWNCRGARGGRDAISLAEHVRSCEFAEAVAFLVGERELRPTPRVERQTERTVDDDAERIARARALWRETRPSRGTIVDVYLTQRRGLPPMDATTARTIRFHPAFPMRSPDGEVVRVPAMVAAMRPAVGVLDYMAGARGELVDIEQRALADERFIRAVHATALADDGLDKRYAKDSRRIRGVAKGATIMLGDMWDPLYGSTVFVGEGLETMLSALAMGAPCAFALGSAGAVAAFEPLPHVLRLRIVAENDEASEKSARECFAKWREQIEDIDVIAPSVGKDANDLLLAGGAA